MKPIEFKTIEEVELVRKQVLLELDRIDEVRSSIGYDCFTEDAEENIDAFRLLKGLLLFNQTPEDLNEAFQTAESFPENRTNNTYKLICKIVNHYLKK